MLKATFDIIIITTATTSTSPTTSPSISISSSSVGLYVEQRSHNDVLSPQPRSPSVDCHSGRDASREASPAAPSPQRPIPTDGSAKRPIYVEYQIKRVASSLGSSMAPQKGRTDLTRCRRGFELHCPSHSTWSVHCPSRSTYSAVALRSSDSARSWRPRSQPKLTAPWDLFFTQSRRS